MRTYINKILGKVGFQLSRANGIPASYKLLHNQRYFLDKFSHITHIDGDIVECGVGFGHSLLSLCSLTHMEGKNRTIRAFDSFEGFPEPSPEDNSFRNPKKGEWKVITTDDLQDILFRRCGLPAALKNQLIVTKGYFEDTLKHSEIKKIAMLHLDVDLYGSYKTCLNELYNKVTAGGIIMFDEYKQKNTQDVFPGAAKAMDEFFADKPEKIVYDAVYDKYYTIKQ